MDKREGEVEDFKATGFEKGLQAKLKKVNAVEKLLRAAGLQQQQKMMNIMELYKQVSTAKQQLMAVDPKVNELPGMNFDEQGGGGPSIQDGMVPPLQGQEQGQLPPGAKPMINY